MVLNDKTKTILGYGAIVLISIAAFWYGNAQRQARIARDATPSPSNEVVKIVMLSPTPVAGAKTTATPKKTVALTATPKATVKPAVKPTVKPAATPKLTQAPVVAGAANNIPTTGPLDAPFVGFLAMAGSAELYRRSRKNVRSLRKR